MHGVIANPADGLMILAMWVVVFVFAGIILFARWHAAHATMLEWLEEQPEEDGGPAR